MFARKDLNFVSVNIRVKQLVNLVLTFKLSLKVDNYLFS